jgi:group I intron endonuclease
MLRNGDHHNIHLQRSWDKHGESSFSMKPIIYCDSEQSLLYEQMALDTLKPEYNIATCAEASARGAKRSEKTKRLLSKIQKGKTVSEETIRKRVESRDGYTHSEQTKEKISNSIRLWHNTESGKRANHNAAKAKHRRVTCLDNNITYNSIKEASEALGIERSHISAVAKGKRNHVGGYRFEYAGGNA